MAQIAREKVLVVRPGEAPQGFIVRDEPDGSVVVIMWCEGERLTAKLSPEEGVNAGVGLIMGAGEASRRLAALRPAPPVILNGKGG